MTPRMAKRPGIALLGADEPLGTEILRLLEERDLQLGMLSPLTLVDTEGCVTVMGAEEPLIAAFDFDWRQAGLLISASRSPEAAKLELAAAEAGLQVIGFTEAGRNLDGAVVTALRRVLAPLELKFGLVSVDITAILPVAALGQQGINELVEETRALFAMESRDPELFVVPIAFNLVPQTGTGGRKDSALESDTVEIVRNRLARPDLAMTMTALWAPVFHGLSMSVHAVLRGDVVALDELSAALAGQDGVVLMNDDLPGTVPTPVTDAQESEAVFVGRLRLALGETKRLAVWLVADMLRLEAAECVDLLEKLIEN
jgi:aspartate-semialdehyde dehydrogenase